MTEPDDDPFKSLRDTQTAIMDMEAGVLDTPTTVEGTFPGERQRAMGHALALVEIAEDNDYSAEREYVGEVESEAGGHRIDVRITE